MGLVALDTWDKVVSAAVGGLLEETQWCELKKMLPPSNKQSNIELAKDLASLSVHGGVLILGVEDKTYEVTGVDASGMRDRISQVAATTVHPPLSPVIYPDLMNPEDEAKVVLVVEVPPSPVAPHMVADKYWGRSSNGKRALGDAEVRDLIASHAGTTESFQNRLSRFVETDPIARLVVGTPESTGHIYLMAEPCAPVPGRNGDFNLVRELRNLGGTGPLGSLSFRLADPVGQAVSTAPGPVPADRVTGLASLLVSDDGTSIEAVTTGAIWDHEGGGSINPSGVASATLTFYGILEKLSLETWGYAGQWRVGIHVAHLGRAVTKSSNWGRGDIAYPRDSYTHTLVVTPATWTEVEPEAKKLLSGFLRAVDREEWSLFEVINDQRCYGQ